MVASRLRLGRHVFAGGRKMCLERQAFNHQLEKGSCCCMLLLLRGGFDSDFGGYIVDGNWWFVLFELLVYEFYVVVFEGIEGFLCRDM